MQKKFQNSAWSARGHDIVTCQSFVLDALIPKELREPFGRRDGTALAITILLEALAHHAALREKLYQLRVLHIFQSVEVEPSVIFCSMTRPRCRMDFLMHATIPAAVLAIEPLGVFFCGGKT
jgi:hypothetical protein